MLRRVSRALLVVTLVGAGVFLAVGTAGAQTAALNLSPSTVAVGGRVNVTGSCDPSTSGFVITQAFLGHGEFAGVPAVAFTTNSAGAFAFSVTINHAVLPGSYSVTARCGGANIGLERTLHVKAATLAATGADSGSLVVPGLALLAGGIGLVAAAAVAGLGRRRATLR